LLADSRIDWLVGCGGMFAVGLYLTVFQRTVGSQTFSTPMFLGFVGAISFLTLWLGLVVVHYSGYEVFEVPTGLVWVSLLLNAGLGTLLSEFLWLWATMLTSPLAATLTVTLTIPVAILADTIFRLESVSLTPKYICGAFVLAFCSVGLLARRFFGGFFRYSWPQHLVAGINLVDAFPDVCGLIL
jgi:solute carrier family 35 protein F5